MCPCKIVCDIRYPLGWLYDSEWVGVVEWCVWVVITTSTGIARLRLPVLSGNRSVVFDSLLSSLLIMVFGVTPLLVSDIYSKFFSQCIDLSVNLFVDSIRSQHVVCCVLCAHREILIWWELG